jgi:stage II sporulation protein Q
LHFEIRKDGVAVNPTDYFQKGLASLDNVNKATEKTSVDKQNNKDSESNVKENTASPEESSTSTDQGGQTDASHS